MRKNPWLAAVLNLFTMGLGTLYIGQRKLTGIGLTLVAIDMTYVELQLKAMTSPLYLILLAGSFVACIILAIDGYNEAKSEQLPLESE
jgi:hypothetical protein